MRTRTSVLTLILALVTVPVLAQTSASLRGTVTDESGGVIAGASVTLLGLETGLDKSTTTNSQGIFAFSELRAGMYSVSVTASGFATGVVDSLMLNVADNRAINVQLQRGEITEEITVTADLVAVELVGAEVAGLVSGEQVRELPLNGRNFTQLALLQPGVAVDQGFNTTNKGLMTGSGMSISGGNAGGNLWLVDGADNNDRGSNRTILVYPSVDAIEEFKVHRSNYGAEFGGASGGTINLITRGGTNKFKGSAYYFMRSDSLNEKNYLLERSGGEKEPLDRKDFGYTIGGPILKDRLHFFLSQEFNDEERGVVHAGLVPTAAERSGDFSSQVMNADGSGCGSNPYTPTDPLTGEPFPGNQIPADRINAAGQLFLQLYALPNVAASDIQNCINWIAATPMPIDYQQENLRVDFTITNAASLMLRYTQDTWEAADAGGTNGLWGDDAFPAVDSDWTQDSHSLVVKYNQTIGGKAVNTVNFSMSGNSIDILPGGQTPELNNQVYQAIPTIFPNSMKTEPQGAHPVFWGGAGYGTLWTAGPWFNELDMMTVKDDFERVFGRHWLKTGIQYQKNKKQEYIGGFNGYESPAFWGASGLNGWGGTTGNMIADFLLDDMAWGFSENSHEPDVPVKWEDYALYVSDSWQLNDRMTLDYGFRYSYFNAMYIGGNIMSSFNPEIYDAALGADPCNGIYEVPGTSACADAGFLGGTPGYGKGLRKQNKNDLAPRLGFAWDLFGNGSAALRAGWGMFHQRDRANIPMGAAGNPPFTSFVSGVRYLDTADDPCGGGCITGGYPVPSIGWPTEQPTAYNMHYNVTYEQKLWENTTLQVGYVGSRGLHQARRGDINQVPSENRLAYVRATGQDAVDTTLRPYDWGADNQITYWVYDGNTEYNSLQTQLISHFGRGSQFQLSWTWSSTKGDHDQTNAGGGSGAGQISEWGNSALDWGHTGMHREHIVNSSLVWHLPSFGDSGLTHWLLGDWSVGAVFQYMSGQALDVFIGTPEGLGNGVVGAGFPGNERPNRVQGIPCGASGEGVFLNPDAWTIVGMQLGERGTARRGQCEGPDYLQVDLALYKALNFKGVRAQFRLEVFNLFNRVNWTGVITSLTPTGIVYDTPETALSDATVITAANNASNFGNATGVREPRQMQLGLKISF